MTFYVKEVNLFFILQGNNAGMTGAVFQNPLFQWLVTVDMWEGTCHTHHLKNFCVNFLLERKSCSVMSDSLQPARHLCPWDSPGKNTGEGCHDLLQVIFPSQGWNPGLPYCRQIPYHLSPACSLNTWASITELDFESVPVSREWRMASVAIRPLPAGARGLIVDLSVSPVLISKLDAGE